MAEVRLPESMVLTYLAEGAANIVYRIDSSSGFATDAFNLEAGSVTEKYDASTPPPTELEPWEVPAEDDVSEYPHLEGKVLRLRKELSTATPILRAQNDYEELIAPLFEPIYLVQQSTIILPTGLIERLNDELAIMDVDGERPAKRRATRLREDKFGTLMVNMTVREGKDLTMIELKPKWLVQSPDAPPGAKRCRTCALRAFRISKGEAHPGICPLDLVSKDVKTVESAITHELRNQHHNHDEIGTLAKTLARFIVDCPLLPQLAELQGRLDPHGPISSDTSTRDFCLAMTLRDCTLFLRVPIDPKAPVEARLGDLDLKATSKSKSWQRQEQNLLDGRWYDGAIDAAPSTENRCALERSL